MSSERVDRRLAAILAADVAGYSRLMGADEEGTLARLKAHRRDLTDPKIAEHQGRIVRTSGDGILVEFPSVLDAVRCAVDVQRGMVERNAEIPADKRIEFRIGINVGDIIIDGDDIFGDGVNVAARLEALSAPGGICISRKVRDEVRDKLDLALEDMGEQQLKNIARPVRVYRIRCDGANAKEAPTLALPDKPSIAVLPPRRRRGWLGPVGAFDWRIAAAALVLVCAALGWWLLAPSLRSAQEASPIAATAPPRLSIVVLPFVNLSNDPEQEYFADGLTDNLTTDVSYINGSFVIARNTAFTYKGKAVDAREIGRQLGVRYVLEGSVQRSGNQIRINAQLIDAETGAHLWAETFDRERGDLFAIEDEITKRIANTLDLQLTKIEAEQAARRGTSADAVDYIMRGNALWERPVSKDNYRAIEEMYERAVQLDGHLPRALADLASALSAKVLDGFSDAPDDDLRRASELVSRALAIDPNYPDAHHEKAQILRAQKHFEEAIAEYETEIALNPLSVSGMSHLARAEILIGEPAKAIPLLEEAMKISPRDPSIELMQYRLGLANLLVGNVDEAIRWNEKAVLTSHEPADAYLDLAAALGLKGDKTAAQAALAEAIKRNPVYATISGVRSTRLSNRPKYVELAEQTVIEGLRKAGLPE